jgi:hypothetical protein
MRHAKVGNKIFDRRQFIKSAAAVTSLAVLPAVPSIRSEAAADTINGAVLEVTHTAQEFVAANKIVPPPPATDGPRTIAVTAVPLTKGPDRVFGSSKHLMFAYLSGRHYKLFGDHAALASNADTQGTHMQGGRQEIISFTVGANDWRLDQDYYIKDPAQVQQAFPDDGFIVTRKDEAFIFAGATNAATQPPFTPPGMAKQVWGRVMAYKPGRGYRDVCKMPPETMSNRAWGGGYDPVQDRFLIPCEVSGNKLLVLKGDGSSYQTLGIPGTFQYAGVAVDAASRRGYLYDHIKAELWAINLDTLAISKVTAVPEPAMGSSPPVDVIWHPKHGAVISAWKLHVYDGKTLQTFTRADGFVNSKGLWIHPSTIFHDPETDDLISIGTIDFDTGERSSAYWRLKIRLK